MRAYTYLSNTLNKMLVLILLLLKNKIQPGKFEDLVGFTRQFMICSVSNLATSRMLQGVVQNERLLWEEGWGKGAISERK